MSKVRQIVTAAKLAASEIAVATSALKNEALYAMAAELENNVKEILDANKIDLDDLVEKKGYSKAFYDRLQLTENRVEAMAEGLRQLAVLPDPVGEVTGMQTRPNGLQVGRVRVPLGVIGIIYEARPNVTADASGLALKAGNAVVLRGSSEAINSNKVLVMLLRRALEAVGLPGNTISLIEETDRAAVLELMKMNGLLDVLIPRGGAALISSVIENATVPVIETGTGNCHTYVDKSADLSMAAEIAFNAKTHRPGVCNAMETMLVHKEAADDYLPGILPRLAEAGVELRGCPQTMSYDDRVKAATEEDWYTEYLDMILAVKVVSSIDEAIAHINRYGSKHSEAIVTTNYKAARDFQAKVDAAAVFVNASTRFTDGFEFGLGAEMGISTQKLHARGPMGLVALTSTKFIINGDGQVR